MLKTILGYGVAGGLIVSVVGFGFFHLLGNQIPHAYSEYLGYAVMLLSLTTVFLAIKQYRDKTLGGVIKFLPAFMVGVGVVVVAGIFYAVGFEAYLGLTGTSFGDDYFNAAIEAKRAAGGDPAKLAADIAQMEQMMVMYRNPLFRMAISFAVEFLPVGLIVAAISAALLRNSRFLPARQL